MRGITRGFSEVARDDQAAPNEERGGHDAKEHPVRHCRGQHLRPHGVDCPVGREIAPLRAGNGRQYGHCQAADVEAPSGERTRLPRINPIQTPENRVPGQEKNKGEIELDCLVHRATNTCLNQVLAYARRNSFSRISFGAKNHISWVCSSGCT